MQMLLVALITSPLASADTKRTGGGQATADFEAPHEVLPDVEKGAPPWMNLEERCLRIDIKGAASGAKLFWIANSPMTRGER